MKFALALLALVGSSMAMNLCDPCCVFVNFIKNEENRDEPAEQAALDAECSKVTQSNPFLTKLCDLGVNTALKILNEDFQKTPAGQLCYDAKLCPTTNSCPNSAQKMFAANVVPKVAGTPASPCVICEHISAILTPIEQELPQVCKTVEQFLPNLKQPCDQIIAALPEVEQLVALCEKYLCGSSAGSAKAAVDPCAVIAKAEQGLAAIQAQCDNMPKNPFLGALCNQALPELETAAKELSAKLSCSGVGGLAPKVVGGLAPKVAAAPSNQLCQVLQEVQTVLQQDEQMINNVCVQLGNSAAQCSQIVKEILQFDTVAEGLLGCQQ